MIKKKVGLERLIFWKIKTSLKKWQRPARDEYRKLTDLTTDGMVDITLFMYATYPNSKTVYHIDK